MMQGINNQPYLINTPWVQCPKIDKVSDILSNTEVPNFVRGSGKAFVRLRKLENKYREWVKDIVDLSEFIHCYFVNGVTDAINQWVATETRSWQYLEGDYEYANMISNRGNKVTYINSSDVLYISNPACATGNFIELKDLPNPIILDCAYLGSTRKQKMYIPKTTEQIWFSFSKGWGLIGQRAGLVFTKQPHKSLEPMKQSEAWNYTSVEIALAVIDNFDIDTVYNQYRDKQLKICKENNFTPADCFFIANSTSTEYSKRRRINNIARLNIGNLLK
jgi:hypothetical protein|tara:strand:- start:11502 stop:12329 length:828 start_codon:yes stop_codon:yes gene_type:complete